MKHQFKEGETVLLTTNYPAPGLEIGAQGRIWVLYASEQPSYEVTFRDATGEDFNMVVSEDEIAVCYVASETALSAAA